VATIAIALGISYGIRWCAAPPTDVHNGQSGACNVAVVCAVTSRMFQCLPSSAHSASYCPAV